MAADSGMLLANAAGIAGPHLPPVVISADGDGAESSSEPISPHALRMSGEEGARSSPDSPKRRRGRSRSGSGSMGGLGLHMPGLPQYSPEQVEHTSEQSPQSTEAGPSTSDMPSTPQTQVTPKRGRGLPELKNLRHSPLSKLFSPPSQRRRGLYESVLERGLSIGISPSSPGFHVGSTFEMDPETIEEDTIHVQQAWKRRLVARRTFSETDTSLASARRDAAQQAHEAMVDGVDLESQSNASSSSSAWSRVMPGLDMQALNDRLRRLKGDAGGWIKGKR